MDQHPTATATPSRRADQEEAERGRARARINAWLLAALVLAFYLSFIGVNAFKSFAG